MSKFYPVSADEMRSFLQHEKGWREEVQGNEIVFNFPLKSVRNVELKVYSGIRKDSEQSRDVGQDAIRVCAVDIVNHKGWIKTARVYRVEGWQDNLKIRVLKCLQQAKARAGIHG